MRPSTKPTMGDLVIFGIAVALFAIIGVRVGMLVSGRLDRMTQPDDEETDGGND
jgi:hypothetical protein